MRKYDAKEKTFQNKKKLYQEIAIYCVKAVQEI